MIRTGNTSQVPSRRWDEKEARRERTHRAKRCKGRRKGKLLQECEILGIEKSG